MKKQLNFLEINHENFINSFKNINFNIVFMVFYDLLFYSASALVLFAGFKFMQKRAEAVNLPANILALNAQQAAGLLGSLRGFFYLLIFTVIFLILLLIINWSLFKGLNWSIASKRKFNLAFFKKFLLLNLAWLGSIIILVFLVAVSFNQSAVPIFLLAIFIISAYFTNILYALFMRENRFKAVKRAFALGFSKIHYFIFPYAVMVLILYVLFKLSSLITLPQRAYLAALILIFTVFIAWSRLYIVEVVNSVN